MIVFRLTKKKYSKELSWIGAEIYGGRWNSKGRRVVYTSESRALSTAEIAVHVPLGITPQDYFLQTIELPDIDIPKIDIEILDPDWACFPHHPSTKYLGDEFLESSAALVLKVPSVVVPGDHNYLLNPLHTGFSKVKLIKVEPFNFDTRLFEH